MKNKLIRILILTGVLFLTGCAKKAVMTPVFTDGMAQPVFPYTPVDDAYDNSGSDIVRYCVWVETDNDMDQDGEKDLIKALIQLPRAAYEGQYKAAAIYEARPYIAGRQFHQLSDPELESEKAVIPPEAWYYKNPFVENNQLYEDLNWYDYFLVRGFAVVVSAGPGTLGSDGYVSLGSDAETDAFASVIEWLHGDRIAFSDRARSRKIKADWCSGKVGMTGKSYAGTTQYALAGRGVTGLETVVPVAGITSWYHYLNQQGVSLEVSNTYFSYLAQRCCSQAFNAAEFAGKKLGYIRYLKALDDEMTRLDGNYGEVWAERDFNADYSGEGPKIPMLIVHGLNDSNVRTNQLERLIDILPENRIDHHFLLFQGGHQTPSDPTVRSEIMIGDLSYDELLNKWFSHYLYGIDNGIENFPAVNVQSNVDGSWYSFDPEESEPDTLTIELETAGISSEGLPKTFEDWTEEVWYRQTDKNVKRYELGTSGSDGLEIVKQAEADLCITPDDIPEDTENLMATAFLVDEAEEAFGIYEADADAQVGIEVITKKAMEQVPGYSAYDLVKYRQTKSDHKVITSAWFDLCNPGSEGSPENSLKSKESVRCGETYRYRVKFDPTIYTLAPGHKLVLYVFAYDLGRIPVNTVMDKIPASFYEHLDRPYRFTIDTGSDIRIPVRQGKKTFDEGNE